jgi:hypothetical protein
MEKNEYVLKEFLNMKKLLKLILLVILLISPACNRNRLKTNEKKLAGEIIQKERNIAVSDSIARVDRLKNINRNYPGRFKTKEDRSVDFSAPPVKIDIANNLDNFAETKLSDITTDITYVRLAPIPDSTIPTNLRFRYVLMDNYIVASNLYGIHLFARDGRYIRQIVKNEMTGVEVTPEMVRIWYDYTLKGGRSVTGVQGNKLFYNYSNNLTGQNYIMEYDCSSTQLLPDYKFDPENPNKISGLGSILIDLNHGNTTPPPPRKHQGMFGGRPEGFYYDSTVQLLDADTYVSPSHDNKNLLVLINHQGDTLSEFTRREKLVNYTKNLMRGTDDGSQYEENGFVYMRPAFNDTVFRITPPNRITPVYVLDLGTYKVTKQQGVDPDFKLTGKIIPEDWAETRKYIFMTFTKDDYDCPNTRKNKTVKIYHAIYYKQSGQLKIMKCDPFNYSPEILENNIDGGIPVWPVFYSISKNGEILVSLRGKDIKDRVRTKEFHQSPASEQKKKELEILAGSVSEEDNILMIIR